MSHVVFFIIPKGTSKDGIFVAKLNICLRMSGWLVSDAVSINGIQRCCMLNHFASFFMFRAVC
jgi:hypothetical protein